MSLRPTERTRKVFGLCHSAEQWALQAIGADKRTGNEGFANYRSFGEWYHPMHYKKINNRYPKLSPHPEALDEMAGVRESLVSEIMDIAAMLDAKIMRLQKMDEEIGEVIKNGEE